MTDDDIRRALDVKREELRARLRSDRDELARIERAMGRIDEGRFGCCIACGNPIDSIRIAADPMEELCRSCDRLPIVTNWPASEEGPYW